MKKFKQGVFIMGECQIIVTIDNGLWHLSISKKDSLPSYEELKKARYQFCPDEVYMAQIFPPQAEFVNVHPFCLHLWQLNTQ